MSEEIQLFKFDDQQIRTLVIDGKPYFVGKDVAEILGYQNGSRDINRHVDDEDRLTYQNGTLGSNRGVTVINESGLYSLILSSKMPKAKEFKHWVTSEVLPSIRKTGAYQIPQTPEEMLDLTMQNMQRANKRLDSLEDDVKFLKDKQEINSSERRQLLMARKQKVIQICGGKKSNFYKKRGSRKVFERLGHDFKEAFDVTRYDSVTKDQFDDALKFTNDWYPDVLLAKSISAANNQTSLNFD